MKSDEGALVELDSILHYELSQSHHTQLDLANGGLTVYVKY